MTAPSPLRLCGSRGPLRQGLSGVEAVCGPVVFYVDFACGLPTGCGTEHDARIFHPGRPTRCRLGTPALNWADGEA